MADENYLKLNMKVDRGDPIPDISLKLTTEPLDGESGKISLVYAVEIDAASFAPSEVKIKLKKYKGHLNILLICSNEKREKRLKSYLGNINLAATLLITTFDSFMNLPLAGPITPWKNLKGDKIVIIR